MDITPLIAADRRVIQGYAPGLFRISGAVHRTPVIVHPDRVDQWDVKGGFGALTDEDFQPVLDKAAEIDVVLLGCGDKTQFLPPHFKQAFSRHGLSLEAMDTGAACRTYNVLMTEGRRVAALLLPVS